MAPDRSRDKFRHALTRRVAPYRLTGLGKKRDEAEEGEVGRAGGGVDRIAKSDSRDARRRMERSNRDRFAGEEESGRGGAEAGRGKSVGILRSAACGSGNRGHLQPATESSARGMVNQGGGGGETRAVREAAELDGGGSEDTAGRAEPHGREDGRGVHGEDASAMAADAGTDSRGADRGVAVGGRRFLLL